MSTVTQVAPALSFDLPLAASDPRPAADGKFLRVDGERFLVKGVTYGTFAPGTDGDQYPSKHRIAEDFRQIASLGLNTVRLYTPPRPELLDEAARQGLRVIVGLPWSQHVAFLDDAALRRKIRHEVVGLVGELSTHPAVLLTALGNEIPPGVVRWHGRRRIERFLRDLYDESKSVSPESLLTYVNYPPTEFLDLSFFDVCSFNVYLHREPELRAYLARLQHVAGQKPLLLAEAGADSIREGEVGQAAITAMHVRAAFEEGACGAVAFAWTDEWWRGGHPVEDWAFGLVDRARQPKPAASAVASAFDDAPFPERERRHWPRVSVIVCAYNAAETIDDCLSALEHLTYPDYEIIVVNDGSGDDTGTLARRHPGVRLVIDTPNGGLSTARNVGLAEATGEIVAYTDADTRADCDWLTYLVQPFLKSDVVGSGGPNVIPSDDPPIAQCIARAPGGPTHVLLDDRTAEHVPGCNMAFRREALLAIGGFNPIYLRAGDDVDVCWRLQARGWKIGFASSALVWHHHRSSITSYWNQQVGYGEGEQWLMAHHPDKFLDGRMLWHGRIYSPLPFVRSLWSERVNAGVWGTAAFPSVYRRDVHPFAFLPNSVRWQVLSIVLMVAGLVVGVIGGHNWAAALLVGTGFGGLAAAILKNVSYALRSDVDALGGSHTWYRAVVAYLHFLQPFARTFGQIRGVLSPAAVTMPTPRPQTSHRLRPSLGEAWRALLLLSGSVAEDRYWSERFVTADEVLGELTEWLRRSHAVRVVETDDGWSVDRDVSVLVGRWSWLDLRALVEDHGAGKGLLRVGTHLRPTTLGVAGALALATALLASASAGLALRWPPAGAAAAVLAAATAVFGAWRTAQSVAVVHRGVAVVAAGRQMLEMKSAPTRGPLVTPALLRTYGLRTAAVFLITVVALGAGTFMLSEAATAIVIGEKKGYAGDEGPAIQAMLDTPGGLAVTPAGDVYFADSNNNVVRRIDQRNVITTVAGNHELGPGFSGDLASARQAQLDDPADVAVGSDGTLLVADSQNHRIRRVDPKSGVIVTIAGTGEAGFDGDDKPATEAALNTPSAVAMAPNGDIYIADTLNYRVRMIDHESGYIHTIAGNGSPSEDLVVGDGGPATEARLNMPSDVAIAPSGDIYIADMHHQRVRRIDAKSGVISTVAGNGRWGYSGDNGPATEAALAGPAGVAVVPNARGEVTVFIADHYNGHVRMVGPDGVIRDVSDSGGEAFGAPTSVAFVPRRGWLYVADSSRDQLVVLNIARVAPSLIPSVPARARSTTAPRPAL